MKVTQSSNLEVVQKKNPARVNWNRFGMETGIPHGSLGSQSGLGLSDMFAPQIDAVEYLLEESDRRADGSGPVLNVVKFRGSLLIVTLSINHTSEAGRLVVSIWGSQDRMKRSFKPLAAFYEKSYCGMYSTPLDLEGHPEVCYLRARWNLRRCDKDAPAPVFTFSVFIQQVEAPRAR